MVLTCGNRKPTQPPPLETHSYSCRSALRPRRVLEKEKPGGVQPHGVLLASVFRAPSQLEVMLPDPTTSSSSPAGGSPARVAAGGPGRRLAARSGNGPGRSPASTAPWGRRLSGPEHQAKPAALLEAPPVGWGTWSAEPRKTG